MNTSLKLPMRVEKDHLFVTIDDSDWIVDTGAPNSFGKHSSLDLIGSVHSIASNYAGLTAEEVTKLVGFPTVGLIAADVLNQFDLVFDLEHQSLTLSLDEIPAFGTSNPLEDFMGIPIIEVNLRDHPKALRMFLDTGAKISYLPETVLEAFPQIGEVEDFYPGYGQFKSVTHRIALSISTLDYVMTAGSLPTLLNMSLMIAGVDGILGNEIFRYGTFGYFPKRKILCL